MVPKEDLEGVTREAQPPGGGGGRGLGAVRPVRLGEGGGGRRGQRAAGTATSGTALDVHGRQDGRPGHGAPSNTLQTSGSQCFPSGRAQTRETPCHRRRLCHVRGGWLFRSHLRTFSSCLRTPSSVGEKEQEFRSPSDKLILEGPSRLGAARGEAGGSQSEADGGERAAPAPARGGVGRRPSPEASVPRLLHKVRGAPPRGLGGGKGPRVLSDR